MALNFGIEKEYIKKLVNKSIKSTDSLEAVLDKIDNLEDYIIISNYLSKSYFNKFEYDYKENIVKCGDRKIQIINTSQIDEIILLKKVDLPIIDFCDFDTEWDTKFINGSLYFEFVDCSENDALRKEIMENSIWLKEKGDVVEQDKYLKECCRIRLYIAYIITQNKNATIMKFANE